jgi:hypothetical protein
MPGLCETLLDTPDDPSAVAGIPRGPRGLWDALASVSTPRIDDRALPVVDISLIGPSVTMTMFDYDPDLATSLGPELDPSDFFV